MGDPKTQSQERAAFPSKVNGERHARNGHDHDHDNVNIIDIRADKEDSSLLEILKASLAHQGPQKSLPDLLLWDAEGLKLFEKITYLESYYLTHHEIELLKQECDNIAKCIEPGTMLIELGSGNLRKIKILLSALDRAGISVEYYALDLDKSELERTLAMIPAGTFKHVSVHGLHGTYDDGQRWLQQDPHARAKPKIVLSLGSTIGSFNRSEAADFLARFAECVQGEGTGSVLLAVDGCKDGEKVWSAYNDTQSMNERFIANALRHANRILKHEAFKHEDWTVKGEWNADSGSHDWYYIPLQDVVVEGTQFSKGERVCAVKSYKYDGIDRLKLYKDANVEEVNAWTLHGKEYGIFQLRRAT